MTYLARPHERPASLRQLVSQGVLMLPGVYDALGARAAQQAGFAAVAVSGNGVSASLLGLPDVGMITMTEMVDHTRRIASAVDIPVIADADTGYGGPLNVVRTVREYEAAGAAAIHIEDQAAPKKCAYLPSDLRLVGVEEHRRRLHAALHARRDNTFLIIARTDARGPLGFEETLRRCIAYAEEGADWVFCATLGSLEEARVIANALAVPLMVNLNAASPLGQASVEDLRDSGVAVALYPSLVRNAATGAITSALQSLYVHGDQRAALGASASPEVYDHLLDTAAWQSLERDIESAN